MENTDESGEGTVILETNTSRTEALVAHALVNPECHFLRLLPVGKMVAVIGLWWLLGYGCWGGGWDLGWRMERCWHGAAAGMNDSVL